MNTFPANTIPQYPGHPQMTAAYPHGPGGPPGVPGIPGAGGMPPGMPQPPAGIPMEAHIAMMQQQQQNYLAQQQQLAAMGHQQMLARQAPATGKKGKKQRAAAQAQAQVLPRHMAAMAPPHGTEHYHKNAMAAPPPGVEVIDPWADQLDELDPRELAMSRFRARNEMMAEVFGPEPIKDIPDIRTDPWQGLGLDGETLEAKVLALETSNAELEGQFDSDLEAFRKRLDAVSSGSSVSATA